MKLVVIQKCSVPTLEGPTHIPAQTIIDIDPDSARQLVAAGRALYIDPKDDPSRAKTSTAGESLVEEIRKAMKAAAKAAAAPASAAN